MPSRRDRVLVDLALDLFLLAPWWLGPPVIALVFAAFWFTPLLFPENNALHFRTQILHTLAFIAAAVVALAWLVATIAKLLRPKNR